MDLADLTDRGIKELKNSINELFKLFDSKPTTDMERVEALKKQFDVNQFRTDIKDVKLDLKEYDVSGIDKLIKRYTPDDNWFDSLIPSNSVKI